MTEHHDSAARTTSRRTFLKQSTAAVIGGTLAATMASARMAHAEGKDRQPNPHSSAKLLMHTT